MPTARFLNCHDRLKPDCEHGFTLIEMLISLAMGLVLIAGLSSIFIADSNVSRVISSRTERMGDLFLASHLMQEALRESRRVPDTNMSIRTNLSKRGVTAPTNYPNDASFTALPYWDATSQTLTYQTLEGNVGIFHYQHTKNDRIYWLRPNSGVHLFAELIRNLDITKGMLIYNPSTNKVVTTTLGGGLRVDLTSAYTNESKHGRTISLSFLVWPRN